MIERISPPGATPRGPYSPAVRAGDFIYVSGQVAPKLTGDVGEETRQVLTNISGVLEACGVLTAFGAGFLAVAWWCLNLDADH